MLATDSCGPLSWLWVLDICIQFSQHKAPSSCQHKSHNGFQLWSSSSGWRLMCGSSEPAEHRISACWMVSTSDKVVSQFFIWYHWEVVITLRVACCLDLHAYNQLVALRLYCIETGKFTYNMKASSSLLRDYRLHPSMTTAFSNNFNHILPVHLTIVIIKSPRASRRIRPSISQMVELILKCKVMWSILYYISETWRYNN